MRVIGVLDLLAGRAVHAQAGRRDRYEPVGRAAGVVVNGDAVALARAYRRLGVSELYAADLDAILHRPRQDALVATLSELGPPLWLDAGARSVADARRDLELAAAVVVVGLETMPSYDALAAICASVGGERVAFSLDLRDGEPVVDSGISGPSGVRSEPAHVVAVRAAAAGAGALIVIDLARVGMGTGIDLVLIARVREAVPGLTLLAGGGVRGLEDLDRLADAGCDGALVATALHDGRLGADEVAAARRYRPNASR
jgi:phosphoribosylformimino-5-aminoimidazole carboxamide ribotide isomerase